MGDDLEERLKAHGRAFEGLMSLTPAKYYYGEDNSDQWQRTKQTKEERREARKAKLDPANIVTAKDVMDENERKRKRELEGGEDEEGNDSGYEGKEAPREGLKLAGAKNKKQKTNGGAAASSSASAPADAAAKVEKRREKRERQKEKKQASKQKEAERKQRRKELKASLPTEEKTDAHLDEAAQNTEGKVVGKTKPLDTIALKEKKPAALAAAPTKSAKDGSKNNQKYEPQEASTSGVPEAEDDVADQASVASNSDDEDEDADGDAADAELNDISMPDLIEPIALSSSNSPAVDSTFSHADEHAGASSSSSVDTSNQSNEATSTITKPNKIKLPEVSHEILKERLQAKIEALRAARKADGPDGKPARTRQELIEARRKKADAKKQAKKESRRQAKSDEDAAEKADAEAQLARLRGSGSPLSQSGIFTPPLSTDDMPAPNFSFGRVSFGDGEQLDSNGKLVSIKKKGAMDAKSALTAAERKAARLAGMDEAKRADIESKELWLNAKKKAHGERVRDDVSLLKKTLKRKEKQKNKSEREWNDRGEGIRKAQEIRQKKREENLQKRKDEKGGKKGNKKKGGPLSEKAKQRKLKNKAFG